MDPIDLILQALEAGQAPDIGVLSSFPDDVRDLYDDFVDQVAITLSAVGADELLESYMGDPSTWSAPLADALVEAGARSDGELIDAAQSFMAVADVRGAARGGHTVDIDDDLEGYV